MKHLRDVMTGDVEMVFPHTSLREAAAKMKKLDVGMLPVCDGERLSGIITDRDIVIRAVSQNCNPEQTLVRDIMTHDVIYSYDDESIRDAANLMQEKQIRRLIVLDRNKKLCGVVSIGDLAVEANQKLAGVTLRAVSESPMHLHRERNIASFLGLTQIKRSPFTAMSALLGTAVAIGAIRNLTRRLPEGTSRHLQGTDETTQPRTPSMEHESHESGIVSPIKNEIVAEHARLHPAGDPAVRRISPSREEAGVKTIRRPLVGKDRSQTGR